jgi:YHS domain-containing protein
MSHFIHIVSAVFVVGIGVSSVSAADKTPAKSEMPAQHMTMQDNHGKDSMPMTMNKSTEKVATEKSKLAPQTTCPVMGGAIDKKIYVDYKGQRVYFCCSDCLATFKKDPETYIKKLESMGQGVEVLPTDMPAKKAPAKEGDAMKGMDHSKM